MKNKKTIKKFKIIGSYHPAPDIFFDLFLMIANVEFNINNINARYEKKYWIFDNDTIMYDE